LKSNPDDVCLMPSSFVVVPVNADGRLAIVMKVVQSVNLKNPRWNEPNHPDLITKGRAGCEPDVQFSCNE
jgi:hypothetical protein